MVAFAMLMLKWITMNNNFCKSILIYIQTFKSYETTSKIVNFIFLFVPYTYYSLENT